MIKTPFMAAIAGVFLLLALGFGAERLMFVTFARETTGRVVAVAGKNDRCGSKNSRHNCTEFTATVEYVVDGAKHRAPVSAGSRRGHDQPVSSASLRVGSSVQMVYDALDPDDACRNTTMDIWGWPLTLLGISFATAVGAVVPPRRRSVW